MEPLPARKQWYTVYKDDPDTNFFMDHICHNTSINRLCITKLAVTCRKAIAHNLLCIISYRLVYLEPITVSTNHICSIIVPLALRRIIFISMHASSAASHMGNTKR